MTDLAVIEQPASIAVPATWEASWKLAQRIAATPFVPSALRGKPESVLAAVLYGAELGLGPMQALSSIHVIDGRPAAAPELMRALVARAGHRIDVLEATNDRVTISGERRDTGAKATITWSMEDAQRAKLAGKGAWATYPRAMLLARATSELARMLFADVIAGLSYTPEEVASIDGGVWDATSIEQAPPAPADVPTGPDPGQLFQAVRALAGTGGATGVAQLAEDHGKRLTAATFASDPGWASTVARWVQAWHDDQADIADAELAELADLEDGVS